MAKQVLATNSGNLQDIDECYIKIPSYGTIILNNLPDISDSKSAVYNNEAIIGRSFPLYTYSHSADRSISMQLHFFVVKETDLTMNLDYLNAIRSAVYPRQSLGGAPYAPPDICQIKCGQLLAKMPICCVLQSYSVKFPTDVAWGQGTFCPFRFDVDTTWLKVYSSEDLPFNDRIITFGA